MTDEVGLDARKATQLVRDYFLEIHGSWLVMFRIQDVERNSDPNVWKVTCSFFTTPSQAKPLKYFLKVNVKTGSMDEVKDMTDE